MNKLISYNPTNSEKVGEVKISSPKDIQIAVEKAKKAFPSWREIPIEKKVQYIEKYQKLVLKHKKELAKLVTLEMGKPICQSLGDVDGDQDYFKHWIKDAQKILAPKIISDDKKGISQIVREPWGVCAVITPWNYPLGNTILGIIPAILSGNTVVFKHSEYTPLCGKRMIELLWETGLPEGVVNIIFGDGKVGSELINQDINFVWFTGSTKVGQEIYKKCGKKFIRCLLELGGSSPAIIFKDVNIKNIINEMYFARFGNCGQVCSAVKRMFVEKNIINEFVEGFVYLLKTKKLGDPLKPETDIGPLVSKKQLLVLEEQVKDAIFKGAKVEIGGQRPKSKEFVKGYFFEPTILTNIKPNMKVITEEVFGPVLPIIPFITIEDAISQANNTPYGLSAEIFTKDLKLAKSMVGKLNAGTVSVNTDSFFLPQCPFGGYKKSGMGRESGEFDFHEFTQVKHLRIAK